jgi:hypothetical protein
MDDERLMHRLRVAKPTTVTVKPAKADELFARIVTEPGDPRLTGARRRSLPHWLVARRPLAAGAGALAVAIAAVVLVLSGTATTPPAFAITTNGDGTVTVQINEDTSLPAANRKLTAMGIHEQLTIYMATGAAAVSGAVNCTPGLGASLPEPPVKVLVGTDGTEVIGPGQSAGNTGEGTYHLARCTVARDTGTGNAGNTGAG